jgi:hypothetical protein
VLPYRHTQIGWPALAGVLPTFVVAVVLALRDLPLAWLVAGIAPIVVLLLGWLTVSVDDTSVVARFGVGLIHRRIPLADIRSFEAVRNPWYYGWGIRLIPGGWLYNVAGLSAVDFGIRDGRHIRIGTPEPAVLCAEVAARVSPRAGTDTSLTNTSRVAPAALFKLAFVPSVVIATAVAIVVGLVISNGERPIEASVGATGFMVKGAGYSTRVPFDQIQGVSLVDELPAIVRRINGFAAGGKLRGDFNLAGIGASRVFVDRDVPPFVVVKTTNGVLIVNESSADATRRLRDDLLRAAGRE